MNNTYLDETDHLLLALIASGGVVLRAEHSSDEPTSAPASGGRFAATMTERLSRLLESGHITTGTRADDDSSPSVRLTPMGAAVLRSEPTT